MMKKKIWELGMTVLLLTGVFWLARTGARLTGADAGAGNGVVLIDSGHGGSDPGKIGIHEALLSFYNDYINKVLFSGSYFKVIDISAEDRFEEHSCNSEITSIE